jgi:ribosome-associated protein
MSALAWLLVLSTLDNITNGSPIMLYPDNGEKLSVILSKILKEQLKNQRLTSRTEEVVVPVKRISRLTRKSKILKAIINAIHDKKGEHIVSLDLRKIPEAVADFFIICEASSTVQVKAIADWIEESVKKQCDEPPYKHEGRSASQWVLIDYVNVVVHVFQSETRKFYKLEEMWSDGVAEEEKEEQAAVPEKKAPAKRAKKSIK